MAPSNPEAKINTPGPSDRYQAAAGPNGCEIQDTSYPHTLGGRLVEDLPGVQLALAQEYAAYLNNCAAHDEPPVAEGFDAWMSIWCDHGPAAAAEPDVVAALSA